MSDTGKSARPRQLTVAGGFVIGGSVLLVLSVFDTITSLQSVEMHEQIVKLVSSPTGAGLGLSVSEALSAMRVGLMVAAACAAATGVLGVYALQRSRAARVALSVLAVPILLTAPLTGGVTGALVAAAILMLWSGPARDWFAGRQIRETGPPTHQGPPAHRGPWEETMPSPEDRPGFPGAAPPASHEDPATETPDDSAPAGGVPSSSLTTAGSSTQPGASTGFGAGRAMPADPAGSAWVPPTYRQATAGSEVPVTVKVACILTWLFSGVVALLYAGTIVVLVVAQDRIVNLIVGTPEWQRANLDSNVLVPALWIGCLMFLGWALGACVLAWFAWRRKDWARWLLTVSAGAAVVAGFVAFPVGILHQLAGVLTIVGLFSAGAREWFAAPPSGPRSGPPTGGNRPETPAQSPPPSPGGKPPVW